MLATDGVIGGVYFDSNDRFCIDGQRLIAYKDPGGTLLSNADARDAAYGKDGTEYRTERESWTRFISHGRCGSGPCSFAATAKDGSQLEFGTTSDARIEAQGRADGAVRVWTVNKITDRNGNYVRMTYEKDQGGYYPREIHYTGNGEGGLSPQRAVQFLYMDRSDTSSAFIAGSEVKTTKRLSTIKTFVDLDGDGSNSRKDKLKDAQSAERKTDIDQ